MGRLFLFFLAEKHVYGLCVNVICTEYFRSWSKSEISEQFFSTTLEV